MMGHEFDKKDRWPLLSNKTSVFAFDVCVHCPSVLFAETLNTKYCGPAGQGHGGHQKEYSTAAGSVRLQISNGQHSDGVQCNSDSQ